ncbi:MAG TPA: glycosyltransferase family 2 protein [Longimicrobiales bacterium]|nr:glycosyltransferase family 2 protein [Longimicrobiales bacterium]
MSSRRIAVVIPAFDAEPFIAETLRSVLAQTRPPDEVVVVDDASGDRTAAVAAEVDPGIRIIRLEENRGGGYARNVGAEATTGELLAFMDADDLWEPTHLANLERAMDAFPKVAVTFCRGQQFGDSHWTQVARLPVGRPVDAYWACTRENVVFPPAALIRRRAFEAVDGFHPDLRCCQDFEFFRRLATQGPFLCVPEITMWYRKHRSQITREVPRNRKVQYAIRRRWLAEARAEAPPEGLERHLEILRGAWNAHLNTAWNERKWRLFLLYLRLGHWIPGTARTYRRWIPRALAIPFVPVLDRLRGLSPPEAVPPEGMEPPNFPPEEPAG